MKVMMLVRQFPPIVSWIVHRRITIGPSVMNYRDGILINEALSEGHRNEPCAINFLSSLLIIRAYISLCTLQSIAIARLNTAIAKKYNFSQFIKCSSVNFKTCYRQRTTSPDWLLLRQLDRRTLRRTTKMSGIGTGRDD